VSEAKHTSGPWQVLDHPQDGVFVLDAGARTLAKVVYLLDPKERIANARLIAMAPTLLDALVQAAGALHGAAECMRKVDAPQTADKLEEIALAALLVIKQATGSAS
jgi:hypothetical protein